VPFVDARCASSSEGEMLLQTTCSLHRNEGPQGVGASSRCNTYRLLAS